jgi:transcriptional regulator with XRE-family HTH domain
MTADGGDLARNPAWINTRTDLAAALRALRNHRGWQNKTIATRLGLAESTVSPWCTHGDRLPSEKNLGRLLRLLLHGNPDTQKPISPDWTSALQRAKQSPLGRTIRDWNPLNAFHVT